MPAPVDALASTVTFDRPAIASCEPALSTVSVNVAVGAPGGVCGEQAIGWAAWQANHRNRRTREVEEADHQAG